MRLWITSLAALLLWGGDTRADARRVDPTGTLAKVRLSPRFMKQALTVLRVNRNSLKVRKGELRTHTRTPRSGKGRFEFALFLNSKAAPDTFNVTLMRERYGRDGTYTGVSQLAAKRLPGGQTLEVRARFDADGGLTSGYYTLRDAKGKTLIKRGSFVSLWQRYAEGIQERWTGKTFVKRPPSVVRGIEARTQRRFGISSKQLGELMWSLE